MNPLQLSRQQEILWWMDISQHLSIWCKIISKFTVQRNWNQFFLIYLQPKNEVSQKNATYKCSSKKYHKYSINLMLDVLYETIKEKKDQSIFGKKIFSFICTLQINNLSYTNLLWISYIYHSQLSRTKLYVGKHGIFNLSAITKIHHYETSTEWSEMSKTFSNYYREYLDFNQEPFQPDRILCSYWKWWQKTEFCKLYQPKTWTKKTNTGSLYTLLRIALFNSV